MEQKPTIQSIKKCKQDSCILSLQETDDAVGVISNWCSTFLSRTGLLAQGEWGNLMSKERNALVTFRDPTTSKVKGKDSEFCDVFVPIFLIFVGGLIPQVGPLQQTKKMYSV